MFFLIWEWLLIYFSMVIFFELLGVNLTSIEYNFIIFNYISSNFIRSAFCPIWIHSWHLIVLVIVAYGKIYAYNNAFFLFYFVVICFEVI